MLCSFLSLKILVLSLFIRLFCDSQESFYARRNKFREHCTYVPTSNAIGCSVSFVSDSSNEMASFTVSHSIDVR